MLMNTSDLASLPYLSFTYNIPVAKPNKDSLLATHSEVEGGVGCDPFSIISNASYASLNGWESK
jgi:hypothetical protein